MILKWKALFQKWIDFNVVHFLALLVEVVVKILKLTRYSNSIETTCPFRVFTIQAKGHGNQQKGEGAIKSGKWADIVYVWPLSHEDTTPLQTWPFYKEEGVLGGFFFDFSKKRAYLIENWWWTSSFEKLRALESGA